MAQKLLVCLIETGYVSQNTKLSEIEKLNIHMCKYILGFVKEHIISLLMEN